MNCPNCAGSIPDDSGFCPFCGKSVVQTPPPQMQYAPPQTQYAPPQYQYTQPQAQYAPPQYQYAPQSGHAPVRQQTERTGSETVTMGEWFGYLVLMLIPICNIIMLFVFAFNPRIKRSKANLARLQLLLMAISIGIGLTLGLIALAVTGSFLWLY